MERLDTDLQATIMKLHDMTSEVAHYVRELGHIKDDVVELRRLAGVTNQLLQEGSPTNPSLMTRVYIMEQDFARFREAQHRSRDWWLKLLATLAATAIIGLASMLLLFYVQSKGITVKS